MAVDDEATPPSAPLIHPCPDPGPVHWLEIELLDEDGRPVPNEAYRVQLPNGQVVRGYLDEHGFERLDPIEHPGQCQVSFPDLDAAAWRFQSEAGAKGR